MDELERVRVEALLTEIEFEEVFEASYLRACELSEKYPSGLSFRHWLPGRPSDRLRHFAENYRETIQRDTAQAQLDKVLNHKDVLIKDKDQSLPLAGPFTVGEATNVRKARQQILDAGFVKCLPKEK
jgi:hypothetical protein